MRIFLLTLLLSSISFLCFAQKQQGYVRTIGTSKYHGKPIAGATVKLKGQTNSVASSKKGTFTLSMNGKKEGEPYQLLNVIKNGYEFADKDFLSRQFAYSSKTSLDIVMISSAELAKTKQEIENNVYETVAQNYKEKTKALEHEATNGAISITVYYQKNRRVAKTV